MNTNQISTYVPLTNHTNLFDSDKDFDLYLNHTFFENSIYDQKKIIEKLINKEKVYISYSYFEFIQKFLENSLFNKFINNFVNNEIKIVLIPEEYFGVLADDFEYMKTHKWFFENKNLLYYQASYRTTEHTITQNLYLGTNIHYLLRKLLKNNSYNHLNQEHSKIFITLNNRDRPDRVLLYNLYDSLSNKDKILASFNFKNIFLEKKLFVETSNYTEDGSYQYGTINHSTLYDQNLLDFYKECLFEILSESGSDGITEKTYKPLICGVPFIIYNQNPIDIINYYKNIDIDINYFNIDYSNLENVNYFIKNTLSFSIEELKEKYKNVFIKANENKLKIFNHFNNVYNQIISL
jgi:hypothetical protein